MKSHEIPWNPIDLDLPKRKVTTWKTQHKRAERIEKWQAGKLDYLYIYRYDEYEE